MCAMSLLGTILTNAEEYHKLNVLAVKIANRHKKYSLRYSRNTKTFLRLSKAVELMRMTYRYSINNIAFGLQISTRTAKKYVDSLKFYGFKAFHCIRYRLYQSKNPGMRYTLNRISKTLRAYIDGKIELLEAYFELGLEPP